MEKIGKYEIEGLLGQGAMGKVYAGVDPLIGRKVAIKVLSVASGFPEKVMNEVRERFVREAQAAGNLNHANIVTIYDIDHTPDGEPYIAMEYVQGKTLKDLNRDVGKWPPARAFAILEQIAAGLAFAHGKGVVHRDVKPENMMVDDQDRLKIMDFGVAHLGNSELTQTGQSIGTPAYMSPEQVRGQKVDGRSDLFSLGIIGYEMLAGERPFTGNNITTIAHKIVYEEPTPLNSIVIDLPFPCHALVDRLIRKEPDQRFQSGEELVSAISDWRAGKATEPAGEGTAILGAAPLVEAEAPAPAAPAPAADGTAVDPFGQTATFDRPAPPGVSREPEKKKKSWLIPVVVALLLLGALGLWGMKKLVKKDGPARQQAQKEWTPQEEPPPEQSDTSGKTETPEEKPAPPPEPVKEPEPEPEPVKKTKGTGTLKASFEYQLGKGKLTISSGGKTLWSERFEPRIRYKKVGRGGKKKIPLGVKETVLKKEITLPAGQHQLTIHVHSSDLGMDTSRHVNLNLKKDGKSELYIRLRSVTKDLDISLR